MADVFTKAQRSAVMARVRSRDNASTEIRTVELLRAAGITGWRRHSRIFGKPDFVFHKAKIALFVDGCFWHGCPRCKRVPTSSETFWRAKIQRNIQRDKKVSRQLRKEGWKVIRIRECRLRMPTQFLNRLKALNLRRVAEVGASFRASG
jgi:DNA mismatch endonuclease (patch repair protein)